MAQPTLFAQLATRFGTQPERLAAEAFAFLLSNSAAVRRAVVDVCAIAMPSMASLGSDLHFSGHQANDLASDQGGISGVIGTDAEGTPRVIVDGRFWSHVPSDQPLRALRQFPTNGEGALLMLAPPERFTSLWAELRRRCRLAGLPVHGDHAIGDPIRWTRVAARQTLILTSWSAVLAGARTRLLADGDRAAVVEIDQLAALCEQLSADAFLPIEAGELAAVSARRLTQLFRLVEPLARNCQASGLCLLDEQGGIAQPGFYGYWLRFPMTTMLLCLSVDRWATLRETPFWLLIYDAERRPAHGVDARLGALASEVPPRLLRDSETDAPLVPLFPRIGVGREAVLADLERQVEEVARLLGESPTSGFGSSA
jgi:hypothetical protein